MWFDYSIRYIKENRTSSLSLAGISLVAATLLSLLCGVCYNLWIDRVIRRRLRGEPAIEGVEPLVIAFFFLSILASLSLIAMIHHGFEITMNNRLHQLGILKSVGATPKQIRSSLIEEILILSIGPIIIGILLGIGLCYVYIQLMIVVTDSVRIYEVVFRYHILVALGAFLLAVVTVLVSAWIPARKISRLQPLDAIHYGNVVSFRKMKQFRLIQVIFGTPGELARKSMYARKKILRTSTISLMLSFLAFISFLNLEKISALSTKHTYFERYKDRWDFTIMTGDDTERTRELTDQIRNISNVKSCIEYKKILGNFMMTEKMKEKELVTVSIDWLTENMSKSSKKSDFEAPIYVLDDFSFQDYCNRYGIDQTSEVIVISQDCLDKVPNLKEEFHNNLVSFVMSDINYQEVKNKFQQPENILNIKMTSEKYQDEVKEKIDAILSEDTDTLKSRIEEEASDLSMRRALRIVIGVFAGLLACIGIANVFSSTLGQVYQRKKEFGRYLSIGLSPKGMKKILNLEVVFIALKPIIYSLMVDIPVILLALNAASIPMKEFLMNAPMLPVIIFASFILLSVWLAYHLGAKKICSNEEIIEILKDETI